MFQARKNPFFVDFPKNRKFIRNCGEIGYIYLGCGDGDSTTEFDPHESVSSTEKHGHGSSRDESPSRFRAARTRRQPRRQALAKAGERLGRHAAPRGVDQPGG
jgi:hypothetical protein